MCRIVPLGKWRDLYSAEQYFAPFSRSTRKDPALSSCVIMPVAQAEMLAAISIGQILAVLVTLNLIALSIATYVILRRK